MIDELERTTSRACPRAMPAACAQGDALPELRLGQDAQHGRHGPPPPVEKVSGR